jgi:hypothetical protein
MLLSAAGLASLALCYAGLGGVCLSMQRHHHQVWRRESTAARSRVLRVAGWMLLALSLVACMRASSPAIGMVLWFGLLSAAAVTMTMLLPYAPLAVARVALAAAPIGLAMLIAGL